MASSGVVESNESYGTGQNNYMPWTRPSVGPVGTIGSDRTTVSSLFMTMTLNAMSMSPLIDSSRKRPINAYISTSSAIYLLQKVIFKTSKNSNLSNFHCMEER